MKIPMLIDSIFNARKVKFAVLDNLHLINPDTQMALVFINLESVFNRLMQSRLNNYVAACIKNKDDKNLFQLSLISNIVNLAQHYRLYFAKCRIDSRVILYWNYPISKQYNNRQYIVDYRSMWNEKMFRNDECRFMTESVSDIHSLLHKIIDFINEVYLVDGGNVESSLIPLVLETHAYADYKTAQKIIISDSKYDFQYINHGYTVLESARDDSVLITKENIISILKERNNIKSKIDIPPNLLPFVLSLLGDTYRDIPKLAGVGLSTILKMANRALENNAITENTTDVELLTKVITPQYQERFDKNYRCTNLSYQMNDLTPLDISKIKSQIVDKFDDRTLRQMNERYFIQCPLMLIDTKTDQTLGAYRGPAIKWDRR